MALVGIIAAVSGSIAYGVHHLDQNMAATEIKLAATEIARIKDKSATDIALAATEIKRVEGERRLLEERLRAEVKRYKYDLQLGHSKDYKPYRPQRSRQTKRGEEPEGRKKIPPLSLFACSFAACTVCSLYCAPVASHICTASPPPLNAPPTTFARPRRA